NVRAIESRVVQGFVFNAVRTRVTGLRVGASGDGEGEIFEADLVVDASGRGSRTSAWLEAAGYHPPDTEVVEVRMAYASRTYRRRDGDLGEVQGISVGPTPENRRTCAVF